MFLAPRASSAASYTVPLCYSSRKERLQMVITADVGRKSVSCHVLSPSRLDVELWGPILKNS